MAEEGISDLRDLLNEKVPMAKTLLHQHLDEIRMSPVSDGKDWHYVAGGICLGLIQEWSQNASSSTGVL